MILTVIAAIFVFGVLIAVHEAGHLAAAKAVGVTVHEFAIGMGPKLFSFTRGETKYSLRLLPIGGYCSMEGENETSDSKGALCNKSIPARLLVMVAGAAMNLLLGFLLYVLIYAAGSGSEFSSNTVDRVIPDSPAYEAGLQAGDEILRVNGNRIHIPGDYQFELYRNDYQTMTLTVRRGDETCEITVTPRLEPVTVTDDRGNEVQTEQYLIGIYRGTEKKTVWTVLKNAFFQCFLTVRLVLFSFLSLFRGSVSLSEMSGPVGIVNEIGKSVQAGIWDVLWLMAMIAVNLGVFNLFPFPALDGGRVFFLLIELIRRKPIPAEKEGMVHLIGMGLLLLLMVFITYQDILKLIGASP